MADALRVEGLSVALGSRRVLHDVTIEAAFGQTTAILGPNGAGKSTLLRAISGLVAHSGEVTLSNTPLTRLLPHERAKLLSFVPQSSLLSAAMPVRDVVMQGRYAHRVTQARRTDDAHAVASAMDETDVTQFAERAFTQLSFGEQRRVLIARALATGAQTILLDEPAAALDIAHSLSLYALLHKLASQGRCIVVVLHDLDDVRKYTDHAVLLQRGRVTATGESRDVLNAERVRDVYGVELIEAGGLAFRLPDTASAP